MIPAYDFWALSSRFTPHTVLMYTFCVFQVIQYLIAKVGLSLYKVKRASRYGRSLLLLTRENHGVYIVDNNINH